MAASSSPEAQQGDQEWSWSKEAGKKAPSSMVPERRSSKVRLKDSSATQLLHGTDVPIPPFPPPSPPPPPPPHDTPRRGTTVRSRGRSSSPLRRPNSYLRNVPTRTFVPDLLPTELLCEPRLTHSRLLLHLHLSSPVFIGGATVEGEIHLIVDGGLSGNNHKSQNAISISKISVTLVGIESCKNKQGIFRALTTDLIDETNPLPPNMAPEPDGEGSWKVQPSASMLPFRLDLPVMMGPPPYESKKVGIQYMVSTTIEAGIGKKKLCIRQSKAIVVLTVHDPEKALVNLSSPLLVADELHFSHRQGVQKIVLAAGIHRQTWIGGYPIFVDVHIDNRSAKTIKKMELQLEKTTTFHSHSAPSINHGTVESLRLPDQIQKEIVARKDVSDGLRGILPISQDISTYQMILPAGSLSIETGRFFGVRFFLNIKITCGFHKRLKVQLPVTVIHPNSIDIPTNALAQVTASIEHKHHNLTSTSGTGSPYRYRPGQAFTAPRRQSYLQLRKDTLGSGDMDSLTRALEASPRLLERQPRVSPKRMKITRRQSVAAVGNQDRTGISHQHHHSLSKQHASFDNGFKYRIPRISNDTTRVGEPRVSFEEPAAPQSGPSRLQQNRSSIQQRSSLEAKVHKGLRGLSIDMMNRGPRLQKSTSGLAFDSSDESDKENLPPKR